MLSLRVFHLFFMLVAIFGADIVGAWAINGYVHGGEAWMLALGVISVIGGVGLLIYAIWFLRKTDRLHIA